MSTQLQSGMLYLIVMCGMLLGIRQPSTFVTRRGHRREQMLWIGGALIVIGQSMIAWHDTFEHMGEQRNSTALLSQGVIAVGYIWLLYGCVGWDRAALTVIPWRYPFIASCVVGMSEGAMVIGLSYQGGEVSLVAQGLCVFVINSMFVRYAIAHRKGKVMPFIGLHMLSTAVMLVYQYQHIDQRLMPDAFTLTSVTNTVLFGIVTWLLASSQRQQRMVIV